MEKVQPTTVIQAEPAVHGNYGLPWGQGMSASLGGGSFLGCDPMPSPDYWWPSVDTKLRSLTDSMEQRMLEAERCIRDLREAQGFERARRDLHELHARMEPCLCVLHC